MVPGILNLILLVTQWHSGLPRPGSTELSRTNLITGLSLSEGIELGELTMDDGRTTSREHTPPRYLSGMHLLPTGAETNTHEAAYCDVYKGRGDAAEHDRATHVRSKRILGQRGGHVHTRVFGGHLTRTPN